MTDYRSEDGGFVEAVIVYARLRQGTWSVVAFDNDEGVWVVKDEDGEVLVLHEVEGTEQSTTGPHIFTPD